MSGRLVPVPDSFYRSGDVRPSRSPPIKSGAQGRIPVIGRTTTATSIWSIVAELRMVTFRLCAPPSQDGAPDFCKLDPKSTDGFRQDANRMVARETAAV